MKHGQKNMALKIFLDAKVILDYYLKREGYESAEQIISLVINGQCKAHVTLTVMHIVNYYLSKEVGIKESEESMLELLVNVDVIDMDHEITVNAFHSKMGDPEDALQYYAGLHHKQDCFISRGKALKKIIYSGAAGL